MAGLVICDLFVLRVCCCVFRNFCESFLYYMFWLSLSITVVFLDLLVSPVQSLFWLLVSLLVSCCGFYPSVFQCICQLLFFFTGIFVIFLLHWWSVSRLQLWTARIWVWPIRQIHDLEVLRISLMSFLKHIQYKHNTCRRSNTWKMKENSIKLDWAR